MRELILTTAAMLMLAHAGHATPWDVETSPGNWEKNPECTGACEIARGEALQKPDRPNGGKPEHKLGEKPQRPATTHESGQDSVTGPIPRFWCIAPDGQIARVNKAAGDVPPRHTLRPCSAQVHAVGKLWGQW